MGANELQTIGDVATKTNSEIILFFVILAIVIIVLAVPLTKMLNDNTRKKREQDLKEQQLLLDVVRGNSEVMSQLKTLLESTNSNCVQCKKEQLASFRRLEDRQEASTVLLTRIEDLVKSIM